MIELYTGPTGNGQRAAIALEECGLPYKVTKYNLAKGEHKNPDYLKINPLGAIPSIVDPEGPGGKRIVLTQSGAIVLYCAEKSGKLLPKDPEKRAQAYRWFMHTSTDVAPASGAIFATGNLPDKPASAVELFEKRLINHLRESDRRLGEAEYLAGELSIADIALYPIVAGRKAMIEKAGGLNNLLKWFERMSARPGIQKGMAASSN
ncbi:MAG: glutathione S-transferase family protein [Alphaproteobacteria bacterium]|nr:glutathione S-transferase family protein [Alphaproteobacteria bacterium]